MKFPFFYYKKMVARCWCLVMTDNQDHLGKRAKAFCIQGEREREFLPRNAARVHLQHPKTMANSSQELERERERTPLAILPRLSGSYVSALRYAGETAPLEYIMDSTGSKIIDG
jgi:hypothetical protein